MTPIDLTRALKIQGWMERPELEWLASMAQHADRICEVGCWKGRTTRALGDHTDGDLYCVDNWCEASEASDLRSEEQRASGADALRAEFLANTKGLSIELFVGHSPWMAPQVRLAAREPFDFVFVDGDHSFKGCYEDVSAYATLVRPGGVIAGHDYTTPSHEDVRKAVDAVFGSAHVHRAAGSIWWVAR